jgi:hypothetical protein
MCRKGRRGYRKRTSLWDIRLRVVVIRMMVHDRRVSMRWRIVSSFEAFGVFVDERLGSEPLIDCHRPTIANGNAVVSSNGRPSVK